jgi:hypothetical protein
MLLGVSKLSTNKRHNSFAWFSSFGDDQMPTVTSQAAQNQARTDWISA